MSILRYWRYRKARKNTIRAMKPWIDFARKHFDGLDDQIWQTPYMRGFLPMIITKFARQDASIALDREQLGLIQLEVWMEFTGQYHDGIGEDITASGADGQGSFNRGCRNADHFFAVLHGQSGALESMSDVSMQDEAGGLHEILDLNISAEESKCFSNGK